MQRGIQARTSAARRSRRGSRLWEPRGSCRRPPGLGGPDLGLVQAVGRGGERGREDDERSEHGAEEDDGGEHKGETAGSMRWLRLVGGGVGVVVGLIGSGGGGGGGG